MSRPRGPGTASATAVGCARPARAAWAGDERGALRSRVCRGAGRERVNQPTSLLPHLPLQSGAGPCPGEMPAPYCLRVSAPRRPLTPVPAASDSSIASCERPAPLRFESLVAAWDGARPARQPRRRGALQALPFPLISLDLPRHAELMAVIQASRPAGLVEISPSPHPLPAVAFFLPFFFKLLDDCTKTLLQSATAKRCHFFLGTWPLILQH